MPVKKAVKTRKPVNNKQSDVKKQSTLLNPTAKRNLKIAFGIILTGGVLGGVGRLVAKKFQKKSSKSNSTLVSLPTYTAEEVNTTKNLPLPAFIELQEGGGGEGIDPKTLSIADQQIIKTKHAEIVGTNKDSVSFLRRASITDNSISLRTGRLEQGAKLLNSTTVLVKTVTISLVGIAATGLASIYILDVLIPGTPENMGDAFATFVKNYKLFVEYKEFIQQPIKTANIAYNSLHETAAGGGITGGGATILLNIAGGAQTLCYIWPNEAKQVVGQIVGHYFGVDGALTA